MARPATIPRLILVDGFAGSGKSTTAQRLWLDLVIGGGDAVWFHEHQSEHPIFEYGEIEDLLGLRPRRFEAQLLARWEAFVGEDSGRTVRIVEGSFIQIPVGVMLSLNVPAAAIRRLLFRIQDLIGPLDPALVYLYSADVPAALSAVGDVRGVQWLKAMTVTLGQSPYGRAHGVHDVNGLVGFYRRQRAIVESVFPKLSLRRTAIDVSAARWDRHRRRVSTCLGIRPATSPDLRSAALLRHVGRYRGTASGATAVVTTDAKALYLQQPASYAEPLLRVNAGHFCVRSLPIDVRFVYGRNGSARRFDYDSRMVNEAVSDRTWVRV